MWIKTLITAGAVIGCVALGTVPANSEVGEFPHTPLVAVKEIESDWVKIQALDGFNVNVPNHLDQAQALADFSCRLYDRQAVMLSFFGNYIEETFGRTDIKLGDVLDAHYLFACALP